MKKLLVLLLLPLLAGCVSYYYPETAIQDGVYYAEDDPAYVNNSYVDYSYSYAGAAYYPWWSMDYFYLGYRPRVSYGYGDYGYGYGYGGYGGYGYAGGGFSIGISYGYSPWYYPYYNYPYYGYYSPWYHPFNNYGYGDHHKRGHHRGDDRGGDHNRYAGNDRIYRRNRGGEDEDGNEDPSGRRSGSNTGSYATSPVRRYVSTGPAGYTGNQGMVIRNRETAKIGKSRLEPVRKEPLQVTTPTRTTARIAQPDYRYRRGGGQSGGEIRYRSSAKQGRSRTGPVDNRLPAESNAVVSAPIRSNYRSRQSGGEIRYRSGAKQGKSRTTPVRTGPFAATSPSKGITATAAPSPTPVVPAQRGNYRQYANGNATRQSYGRAPSGASSRPATRNRARAPVSNSNRSPARSSGSVRSSSGHSSSGSVKRHR